MAEFIKNGRYFHIFLEFDIPNFNLVLKDDFEQPFQIIDSNDSILLTCFNLVIEDNSFVVIFI